MGKYEEALERARVGMPLNKVFPELNESEDERIIREISETLRYGLSHEESVLMPGATTTLKEALAYLEKQKEYKSFPLDLSIEDVEIIKTALRESGLEFTANQRVYDKLEKIPTSAYYLSTVGRSELYPDGRVERHIIGYLEKQKEQKPTKWDNKDLPQGGEPIMINRILHSLRLYREMLKDSNFEEDYIKATLNNCLEDEKWLMSLEASQKPVE